MKSGNLKFLETSGTLQACNGTALPSYKSVILMKELGEGGLIGNMEVREVKVEVWGKEPAGYL